MYSVDYTVLFSDDASKSSQETNLRIVVAIVTPCIGLITLVTIAVLICTVIKRKKMRNPQNHQSREVPPAFDIVI